MIRIDGSYGEGGGQILRTALALSSVLDEPFEIYNIRKGRKKPGLQPQHLTCVNAAAQITQAQIEGNAIGSERLVFDPSTIVGGNYKFNVALEKGSAGSVTLVAQTILPVLFFANDQSQATIKKGGTHVPFSPPFDYLTEVLLPTIARFGYHAQADIKTYGFYPVGGCEVILKVSPASAFKKGPFEMTERGEIENLSLVSAVARLPLTIAKRQKLRFLSRLNMKCSALEKEVNAPSPGTYLFLKCEFRNGIAGFSSLGARGKPAEKVADEVFEEFSDFLNNPGFLDPHLADQVLIFLALARIPATLSVTKVTPHLLTNIWVIQQFLKDYTITLSGICGKPGQLNLK